MENKIKRSRLARFPAWAWSSCTVLVSFAILRIGHDPKSTDFGTLQIIVWIGYLILITAACYIICKTHPKSVWYTPVICNAVGILGLISNIAMAIGFAIVGQDLGTTSAEWIMLVSSVVLSVTGAMAGARTGRRRMSKAI